MKERQRLEVLLEEARQEAKREATRRHGLENNLGDTAYRARGLADLVEREAASLDRSIQDLRHGPARSRAERRIARLRMLALELDELYSDRSDRQASVQNEEYSVGLTPPERDALPSIPQRDEVFKTRDRGLRVTAVGGSDCIGGSALLLEAGATRLLVDAGVLPTGRVEQPATEALVAALSEPVDAIVVTHAHADHAGYVPKVVDQWHSAKVFCTPETMALLPTVWNDAVKIMAAEAESLSGGGNNVRPAYGEVEVEQAEDRLRELPTGMTQQVGDFEITLFPAGHVLGAAGVVVTAGEHRVVITGDIDNRSQGTIGAARIPPRLATNADLLIIETTYCDSTHPDRGQEGLALVRHAEDVINRGGRVLIPAFGLGRAQEVALLLGENLPDAQILVDGLAVHISKIYEMQGAPRILKGGVRQVQHRGREIRGMTSGIVITTSGMLTGGAAVPWARAVLPEPDSALFLCGHQDEEAPGRRLLDLARTASNGRRQIVLNDEHGQPITVPVASAIETYNLSAHADRPGLLEIIKIVDPAAVMLVHGERAPQRRFTERLTREGRVVVDNQLTWSPGQPVRDVKAGRRRHPSRHPARLAAGGPR
ncbi:MBL fold metallo-hydrolase [Pseudofrankia sp. BMG5.37]|uniref:MBL fold metallo-hydrolase n=1 Tax=Pseudofrankia sp. BMG5.37 TaxID=3050035 RepID=UPI0028947CC6|nr:MBL fold metallo-hydrolase [Pseudofrankia sp. BMG5.37]MDT3438734.1 MBL fold metallo-hydrolase [Pseudofrankia sp. BMG5.37]